MKLFGLVILKESDYDKLIDTSVRLSVENVKLIKKLERLEQPRDNKGRFVKK